MNIHEGAPLERHEQEGVLAEQIKDALGELEVDLREIMRLAAAAASNPNGSFGFQDDLAQAVNDAKAKFENLVGSMIDSGRASEEATRDSNQDLFN